MTARCAGWLTCADCSSLGLDKATGHEPFPESGRCDSCGGPWPLRPASPAADPLTLDERRHQRSVDAMLAQIRRA